MIQPVQVSLRGVSGSTRTETLGLGDTDSWKGALAAPLTSLRFARVACVCASVCLACLIDARKSQIRVSCLPD